MREKFITAQEIAHIINGEVYGDKDKKIYGISLVRDSDDTKLTFVNRDYNFNNIDKIEAAAIIVPPVFMLPPNKTYIISSAYMYEKLELVVKAFVDRGIYSFEYYDEPIIEQGAKVGMFSVIGNNTYIGKNTKIGNNVSIGNDVKIGENCFINSNAVIYDGVTIMDNVVIKSGAIIGSESFELCECEGEYKRIPNIGSVVIHNDVDIGANTTIDKGTIGDTIIGAGTKIDNLVQIGHEAIVGQNCKICAQSVLAGWVTLKDYVTIYGQCAISNNVVIEKNAIVLGFSGVTKNVKENAIVSGIPAIENKEYLRCAAYLRKLYKNRRDR